MRRRAGGEIIKVMVIVFSLFIGAKAEAKTILGDFLEEKGMDIKVDVSASMDVYNKYVWRGMLLDDDVVLQPGITIAAAGFEGGFWGSWDVDHDDDTLLSDEVDGWIGYGFDFGFINEDLSVLSMSVGNTWYDFPEAELYTKELYVGLALDTLLSPSFTWYHDYGDEENGGADGNYYIFGAGHSFSLNEDYGITLDLGGEVGINDGFFIVGDGGYYAMTAGLTVPLTETLTMAPSVGYSVPYGDLEDEADGNHKEQVYAGVSLGFSF